MVSNDNERLEQLLNELWNSKEKLQITEDKISSKERELSSYNKQNDRINSEINQLISKYVGQSEVSNSRERKIIESKLESFSYQQRAMNQNIVELIDMLKSTKALDETYQLKREKLEYIANEQADDIREMLDQEKKKLEDIQEKHKDLKEKVAAERAKLGGLKFFKGFKYLITSNATLLLVFAIIIFLVGVFIGINVDKFLEDHANEQPVQTEQVQQQEPQQ